MLEIGLKDSLPDTPVLSHEDKELIEGSLTYADMHAALTSMKTNKRPGPHVFFLDIGKFLVRSVNYCFNKEELSVTQKQGVITCIPKDKKT